MLSTGIKLDSIFAALRIIPTGPDLPVVSRPRLSSEPPLSKSSSEGKLRSPYEIFFHVYKPSTRSTLRKTNPPRPDFWVSVVE